MKASVLLAVLVVGCGFSEAEEPLSPQPDESKEQAPDEQQPLKKTASPTVDPISSSACGDSVPVQGTAVPGVSVIVFGGLSSIATDAHPVSGRFCLDVPLNKDTTNYLEVRAQDAVLELSDPGFITVAHSKCGDDVTNPPDQQPQPKNVAFGATVTSKDEPKENNGTFMVDDDSSTWVEFGGNSDSSIWGWSDYDGWVMVELDKLEEVEKIVVRWRDDNGNGDKYAAQYKILVTSMSSPSEPNLTDGLWQEMGEVKDGDGGEDSFHLLKSTLVKHVAIWLQQDAKPHWKENLGVPFDGGKYEERFAIAELEVWKTVKSSPSSAPPAFTCTALGSI